MELFDLYGSVRLDDHATKPLEDVGERFKLTADEIDKSEKKVSRFGRALRKLKPVGNLWGRMKGGFGPGGFGGRGSTASPAQAPPVATGKPTGGRRGGFNPADIFKGAPLILGALAIPIGLMNRAAGTFDQALTNLGQTMRRTAIYTKDYGLEQRKAMKAMGGYGRIDTERAAELARDLGASDVFAREDTAKAFKILADNQGVTGINELLKNIMTGSYINWANYEDDPDKYNRLEGFRKMLERQNISQGGHHARRGIDNIVNWVLQNVDIFDKAAGADDQAKIGRVGLRREAMAERQDIEHGMDYSRKPEGEFLGDNLVDAQETLLDYKLGFATKLDQAGKAVGQMTASFISAMSDVPLIPEALKELVRSFLPGTAGGYKIGDMKVSTEYSSVPVKKEAQAVKQPVIQPKKEEVSTSALEAIRDKVMSNLAFTPEGGGSTLDYTNKDMLSLALQTGATLKEQGLAKTNKDVFSLLGSDSLFGGSLELDKLTSLLENKNPEVDSAYSGLINRFNNAGTSERVVNNNRELVVNNNREREVNNTRETTQVIENPEVNTEDHFRVPPAVDLTQTNTILGNIYALLQAGRGDLVGAVANVNVNNNYSNHARTITDQSSVYNQIVNAMKKNPQTGF